MPITPCKIQSAGKIQDVDSRDGRTRDRESVKLPALTLPRCILIQCRGGIEMRVSNQPLMHYPAK